MFDDEAAQGSQEPTSDNKRRLGPFLLGRFGPSDLLAHLFLGNGGKGAQVLAGGRTVALDFVRFVGDGDTYIGRVQSLAFPMGFGLVGNGELEFDWRLQFVVPVRTGADVFRVEVVEPGQNHEHEERGGDLVLQLPLIELEVNGNHGVWRELV